jgi:hypothetical protein
MNITENSVPHCGTAEQGIAEEEAIKKGMEAKSKEFVGKGQRALRESEKRTAPITMRARNCGQTTSNPAPR